MILKFENATFCYKGKKEAVSSVTAEINPGIHLMVGENGAGKTTLLHMACGLLRPQLGLVTIDGTAVGVRSPRVMNRLFILVDDPIFPAKSINDCVKYHACFYPNFSREILDDCLQQFGLTGDEPLERLSLGNRKKSMLAYCLALKTELLLLDEPSNGLDINSKKTLQRLLATHIDDSQTVIVSTHTTADLHNLYSGLIVIHHGRLLLALPVTEITSRLAFVVGPRAHDNALYAEPAADGTHSVIPNANGLETDIDFELLYSALTTANPQQILSILNK
jgi:ABC-2 type transport system ATP-binding protein